MSDESTADPGPHLILVNPNTSRSTTAMLRDVAERELAGTGIGVRAVTAAGGPRIITRPDALSAAVPYVLDAVRSAEPNEATVGVVVGAIGDPGADELRAALTCPVVGIGEAAIRAAATGGRRFGMITTTAGLVDSLTALVERHVGLEQFAGVRLTQTTAEVLVDDPVRQLAELEAALHQAVRVDGVEAVIVAGGPLSDAARALVSASPVPVIEPVPSAVAQLRAQLVLA